jgi:hypothetical protein
VTGHEENGWLKWKFKTPQGWEPVDALRQQWAPTATKELL